MQTPQNTRTYGKSANLVAPMVALGDPKASSEASPADPDLSRLLSAWPELPEHIRAAVMALIDSARYDGERNRAGNRVERP